MPIDSQAGVHSLAAYPPWLVIPCAVIGGMFLVWLAGKLLKWSVEVIFAAVLILAGAAAVWLLLR
jgi:apolipoprotein N-acyltransferase